jgi:hypothetical protein
VVSLFGCVLLDTTISLRSLLEIFGILISVWSFLKLRGAKRAARIARHKLLNQRAVDELNRLAVAAAVLHSTLTSRKWDRASELAIELRGSLAAANGSWARLLTTEETADLEVAIDHTKSLVDRIPIEQQEQEVSVEDLHGMTSMCDFVIDAVNPIAGRLKYIDEPEEESWAPTLKNLFRDHTDRRK